MVPVVRVVVPISGRPNGLKAGHGKPKRFPTEKTSRLRSFTCERTDMLGGAHQRCCAVTLATPGSLLPVLTPLLLQGRVQPAGQLVYNRTHAKCPTRSVGVLSGDKQSSDLSFHLSDVLRLRLPMERLSTLNETVPQAGWKCSTTFSDRVVINYIIYLLVS